MYKVLKIKQKNIKLYATQFDNQAKCYHVLIEFQF